MDGFTNSLHFALKLRCDAGLYELFTGKYCGRGPHPKYGGKVEVRRRKRNTSKFVRISMLKRELVYLLCYLVTLHLF